jgi:hypothetical protein
MPVNFMFFGILRIGVASSALIICGIHANTMLHVVKPAMLVQAAGDIGNQIATNTQQLKDVERRVQQLEHDAPMMAVQAASMQAQLDAIKQMLIVVIGAMVTLAVEAIWRMAGGKKLMGRDGP